MIFRNRFLYKRRKWPLVIIAFGTLGFALIAFQSNGAVLSAAEIKAQQEAFDNLDWAFIETFDGDPASPSQDLLPRNFNYVITHRTHPQEHFTKDFELYPADHDMNCGGPNPAVSPLPQHLISTNQATSNSNPDKSFFICKNHMMTAIGEVDAYSVSAFYPRQEFNFSDGGVLEFDVSLTKGHTVRHWFEVMIVPRDQIRLGAGPLDSPIDETYPEDRIVLEYRRATRGIKVGTGAIAPDGWIVNEQDFGDYDYNYWYALHPNDPALDDRRVRRTMRVQLQGNQIIWGIEKDDGSFDNYAVDVPGGLPFDQGLVMFKTHSYTPSKDNNTNTFTFHWDNIRFTGPVVGLHNAYDADDVVYLQRNGDREIGETETVNINVPSMGANPVLIGQVHQPKNGQVLLSINGRQEIAIHPQRYNSPDCMSENWKTFRLEVDPSWIHEGNNTFKWTIGPRPNCDLHEYDWNGFSIKSLQLQMDRDSSTYQPPTIPVEQPLEGLDYTYFCPIAVSKP
ncbi:MAG: hypothetical protein AAF902_04655 [Chloroflexota bacterium]